MTLQTQNIIVAAVVVAATLWLIRKLWKRRSNPCEMCGCSAGKLELPKPRSPGQPANGHSSRSDGAV